MTYPWLARGLVVWVAEEEEDEAEEAEVEGKNLETAFRFMKGLGIAQGVAREGGSPGVSSLGVPRGY